MLALLLLLRTPLLLLTFLLLLLLTLLFLARALLFLLGTLLLHSLLLLLFLVHALLFLLSLRQLLLPPVAGLFLLARALAALSLELVGLLLRLRLLYFVFLAPLFTLPFAALLAHLLLHARSFTLCSCARLGLAHRRAGRLIDRSADPRLPLDDAHARALFASCDTRGLIATLGAA